MKDKVTIVVPTYNRHHHLERIIPFLLDFNMPVLVVDSTATPHAPTASNPDVEYLHMPGVGFQQKLKQAISNNVRTPYMLMNADDIYPLKSSLSLSLQFLEENPDYSSVQGSIIYETNGNLDLYKPESSLHQVDAECPGTRMLQHMVYYHPVFYSLQKTDAWKTVFRYYPDEVVNYNMMEIHMVLMMLAHGKAAKMRYLHHITSIIPCAEKRSLKTHGNSHDVIHNARYYEELTLVKEAVREYLVHEKGMPEVLAKRHVDNAVSLWLVNALPKKTYYWLNDRPPKTLSDRIRNEWDSLMGKTVQKKQKVKRKEKKDFNLRFAIDELAAESGPEGCRELDEIVAILTQGQQ
ncbi:TIGR00180 family glycosyltransferase [uncultured Pseudodesulfovibrio sp.]|uniref:TIGR00180 family glycosyltransferase n=1 Tax=uncultured Pseudodesulfovibrio sp. TaxID=2035858 RepID=UPI0029C67620|nr:TIGR00180 family glycosyltransferase [uncultured Pseudodesulfovibrio sp.]